jgi:redox-sensitive bicupin YhaK (pirin superfamily)
MGRFYAASQRGEMHLGVVERFSVFNFANKGESEQQGLGSLRVLNEYHLSPGAKLDQQWFDPFGLCVLNLQGCYTHKTSQGKFANVVTGQGLMLWTDDELELEVVNPSPYEELVFLQLWFDFPAKITGFGPSEHVFPLPFAMSQAGSWFPLPLVKGSQQQNPCDIQMLMQHVPSGHAFKHHLDEQTTGWLYLLSGHLHVNNHPMSAGDSFALSQAEPFEVNGSQGALLLLIEHRPSV